MKGEGRRKEREVGKEEGRKTGKGRASLSPCSVWHPIISSWNTMTAWWEGCAYPVLSGRQVHSGWSRGTGVGLAKLEGCVFKDALEGGVSLRQAHLSLPFSPIALEIDTEHPWSSLLSQESDHLAAEPTTLAASGCSLCPHPLPFLLHHQFWF